MAKALKSGPKKKIARTGSGARGTKAARPAAASATRRKKPVPRPKSVPAAKPNVKGHWVGKEELTKVMDRLREAQETLDAIRSGEVDAVVVSGPHGNQIYSLSSVEQPYRVYVENMQEGAVTISADGVILYCNQRFAGMLKMPLERVIGSPAREHLPEHAVAVISRVIGDNQEVAKLECTLHCADESAVPVHLAANTLSLEDQPVICLVVTDLTLQRGQEELRTAKEVAERANLAKDSFLAALSHELRTPLTPALMSLMALEREETLNDFVRSELSMIRRNIELETRLIDDLLDLTRIANGKLELHTAPADLHAVLHRAIDICRPAIEAKHQRLKVDLRARRTLTVGDAVRLQQVLWNLLRNAVKFTANGGTLTVTTENVHGDHLQFEVQDTGIGFNPDDEQKLFRAFEQSGRGITQQFGGLGLGLSISRSIVEAHGGTIRGSSPGPGAGAVFSVVLPLQDAPAVKPPRPRTTTATASCGYNILVVEDHPDTRATLQRLLDRRGHRVAAATSGAEALDTANAHTFDMVISDLGLPDMTGNELMTHLRNRHGLPGIAVSGYGMEDDVARSREAGFMHHLTKPIEIDRLVDVIEKIMTRQPAEPN
jgi:signal transduction histidine kinase/ActR/RegA family two-component response regulator